MEKPGNETIIPGSRQSDLKKSFKSALRSLLTACPKQIESVDFVLSTHSGEVLGFPEIDYWNLNYIDRQVFSDFLDIFSKFNDADQKLLYRLYTQVIVNLHQTLEDEFDAQCHEFQVGPILDKVEQLIEEQSLDPLFSDKTNVMDIAKDLTTAKQNEIQKLTGLLQRAEEQNRQMEARISLLRKQPQEGSSRANAIEKLKSGISVYFEGNDKLSPI